jgi:hypothetical protein
MTTENTFLVENLGHSLIQSFKLRSTNISITIIKIIIIIIIIIINARTGPCLEELYIDMYVQLHI